MSQLSWQGGESIAESELAIGLLVVMKALHGGTREELIVQTAREFGFRSAGPQIKERIGPVIQRLIDSGVVESRDGALVLGDDHGR